MTTATTNRRKSKYGSRLTIPDAIDASYKHVVSERTGIDYLYLVCPTCDRVLNKNDRYCRECGHRIRRYSDGTEEM